VSDADLRELERRWRATRAVEDEARYLAARLRAGELTRERLELAAWIGHAPARVALGDAAPAGEHVDHERLARGVDPDSRVALVRDRALALRALASRTPAIAADIVVGVEALERWCACPCDRHLPAEAASLLGTRVNALVHETAFDEAAMLAEVRRAAEAVCERDVRRSLSALLRQRPPSAVTVALGEDHAFVAGDATSSRAQADWLRGRVARGELARERIEAAAYAGDEAATMAAACTLAAPPQLIPFLEGLRAFGDLVLLRGVTCAARYALMIELPWQSIEALLLSAMLPGARVDLSDTGLALQRAEADIELHLGRRPGRYRAPWQLALRLVREVPRRPEASMVLDVLRDLPFGIGEVASEASTLSATKRGVIAWCLRAEPR
jgi:hypothetical protein